jgi:pimeloyl-ACP methyl ester carboxylesterase
MRAARKWAIAAVASLTISGLTIVPSQSSTIHAAHASAPGAREQVMPTIVLVHGAWADGSSWAGVVRRLQNDGYTVDAPPNPLRGLATDSATIADFLATISGPIVLVGHSYGGAVITNAAAGNANVKALVYIDAFIPDQGESEFQLLGAYPGSCVAGDPAKVFNLVPYPGAPQGDFDAYLKPAVFQTCFANLVPAPAAAIMATAQRPPTLSSGSEKSGVPAWKTIPSWSLIGTADQVIPPAAQRFMSKRANAHITEVLAGHLSMVSRPDATTHLIEQAVQATS